MADLPAGVRPSDRRRLAILCVTAACLASCLGTYLLGPMLPGGLGRLQAATWSAWGWAGPAQVEIAAEPAGAWIQIDGPAVPGGIQGRALIRAQLEPGVYHCRVGMPGYVTQEFELACGPDQQIRRRVTLEPQR